MSVPDSLFSLLFLANICTSLMVQQTIDKFNEYDLIRGSAMSAVDKQHPASLKEAISSELPNSSVNIISKPTADSSVTEERGPFMDSEKSCGTKRQQPDCSLSPSARQPILNKGTNGHLVYVRRKLEADGSKKNTSSNNVHSRTSPLSNKSKNGETEERATEHNRTQACNETSHSDGKGINEIEPNDTEDTSTPPSAHSPVDPQEPINHNWKDRYLQLQRFLNHCNQSSQEDYKQMLRSLSAVERSKHAVELEKRALHLLLEEGKELHRMQILNIVDEAALQEYASTSSKVSATKS